MFIIILVYMIITTLSIVIDNLNKLKITLDYDSIYY